MPIDQQMQRQDDGRHAGHPEWDGGRTSTSCAEWQGHQNVCSSFQRLLKSRDIHFFTSENDDIKWPMVEHFQRILQGTIHATYWPTGRSVSWTSCLPFFAPTTPHITQHHMSQCHWHGAPYSELGQWGAPLGVAVLSAMPAACGRP